VLAAPNTTPLEITDAYGGAAVSNVACGVPSGSAMETRN